MDLTKKLREKHPNFEVSQKALNYNPIVVETSIVTFEFDGEGANARTNQRISTIAEGKTLKDAKLASLKNGLELLGVA
jgi:hypothetical protein